MIQFTTDTDGRKKWEDLLLAEYPDSGESKALQAFREIASSTKAAKLTPESELEGLLEAGKRDEAAKFLITAAIGRNGDGVEAMWQDFLREYPDSTYSHLAVTRLAETMTSQQRVAEAVALLDGWLKAAEGKSAATDLVSNRLAHLRQQQEAEKESPRTAFEKDRQEAIAKLPAELETLYERAKSGKGSGKILNHIRDIRRSLRGSDVDTALQLQLDRAEALALHGLRDPRRALGLLEDSWKCNSQQLASKDSSILKAVLAIATDALGIALDAGNHPSVVIWSQRVASETFPAEETTIRLLKASAIRLIQADAKSQGITVLSLLGDQVLTSLPEDSRLRKEEAAAVARLKALCTNGKAMPDNEWFVGELPLVRDSRIAREMFRADLMFAARETEKASRAYSGVILKAGLDTETEGYATMQMARCLAAIGEHEQALRIYRRFVTSLAATKSAAPALLRAGTLCGGPMNDARGAKTYFNMVSARYPTSPEAELCDWYTATLLLWEGDLRASRTAFDEFEKKHPQSPFISALNDSIRPQL